MVLFAVGLDYPFACEENLVFHMQDSDGQLEARLQLGISAPTAEELHTLSVGALTLALLPSPPLTWILLTAKQLKFDAPYDVAVEDRGRAEEVVQHLARWAAADRPNRHVIDLHVVGLGNGLTRALRRFSMSAEWMTVLASSVLQSADPCAKRLTRADALSRDYRRWPNISAMLREAAIVERCGRL